MKKLKTSFFTRAPGLIKATTNIIFQNNIDETVEQFKNLKGLPQKAGQMLSMDISEYFPPELKEKLSVLQSESEPISFEIIESILKNGLKDKYSSITKIDQTPIGAGSIGQVHKAELNTGEVIVFKIRYPEIEKTIVNDLNLLIPFAKVIKVLKPQTNDFDIVIRETKRLLELEIDYNREREIYKKFYELTAHNSNLIVPKIYDDFSTEEFICMEYVEGQPLKEFLQSNATPHDDKKLILENILDLFVTEFLEFKMVQTDPNFANYKVTKDNKLVLLDFGATLNFNDQFIKDYLRLLKASYEEDGKNIIQYGERLGLIFKKDNHEAVLLFEDFLIDVFANFKAKNNPVNFSDKELTERLMKKGWELWKKQRISNPHSDILFLHRKIGGLFSMLKESKCQIDLSILWPKILKHYS